MSKLVWVIVAMSFIFSSTYAEESYRLNQYDYTVENTIVYPQLKYYLDFEYDRLNESELKAVNALYQKILVEESINGQSLKLKKLYHSFYSLLKGYGIKVPVQSLLEFAKDHASQFTQTQLTLIEALEPMLYDSSAYADEQSREALYNLLRDQFKGSGYNFDEIVAQIEYQTVEYAKFVVKDKESVPAYEESYLRRQDLEKVEFLIDQLFKIIPPEYRVYIESILIYTDGNGSIMGYVEEGYGDFTKWVMALDLKDAYDEEGIYELSYDETLVHEFAHVLSLNASQMDFEAFGTYETIEGILSEKSYLNDFYQQFWLKNEEVYNSLVDPMDFESVQIFYTLFEDEFITEYAAINPEEDFAETFSAFVFWDGPIGNSIKEQKIKWFIEQIELVRIRNIIRQNLKLE